MRSNSACAATPVRSVLTTTPTVLSSAAGHRHLAEPPPGGLQAALVEDQRRGRRSRPRARAPRRRTRSRPVRRSRAASRARGRRRAPAARSARRRARPTMLAARIAPTSRSIEAFVHGAILSGRESRRARATLWHGYAPEDAEHRPPVRDRPGRGPARLRLLLRAASAHRPACRGRRGSSVDRTARRLGAGPAPAGDARRARPDLRQVRAAALDPARRRPAGHRRRAPRPPGRRPAVPVRAGARRVVEAELGLTLEQAFLRFDEQPDRRRLDRPGAPRDAPERRRGRRQGAAAERAATDRVRSRAALPGRAHHQGARPGARLHRRRGARRRVRALRSGRSSTTSSRRRNADQFRRNFAGSELRASSRRSTGPTRARGC